ncbi:hypothetical protein NDR87_25895 [Nocardia sp. CDC159]|uniref:Uncharacterized protein n=1 Tax=Nocardia pulmonis TaxID=2951408 RepID=A0A9X2IXQ1_9NOCA|nr:MULTISPECIES: hypothetical protein [Nocardia]MCM6774879.1 hypothetical protein [Nocardia pulmonis]MCM6789810.1 hypothetical protein [Nocardia sp. CDC159]
MSRLLSKSVAVVSISLAIGVAAGGQALAGVALEPVPPTAETSTASDVDWPRVSAGSSAICLLEVLTGSTGVVCPF